MKYPKIIPELNFKGDKQTNTKNLSFKHKLNSIFFYSKIDKDNKIYLKLRNGKLHYNPLFTMTKALAYYNDNNLNKFKLISKELINSMDEFGWKHNNLLQLPGYPKKKESYSALNNGRGLGVLIRYYNLNPSKQLLSKIKKVLFSFEILSSKGGVLNNEGYYLEYSWGENSPVVWNGFMSALVGLYDCYLYGPKEVKLKAKKLFDKGIKLLLKEKENLFFKGKMFYLMPFEWIRYDTNKLYFADGSYIKIEIKQLEYLSKIDKRLESSLNKMKKIYIENKKIAGLYEYYYFLKKRMMK
jgi:hypothetical protein